MAYLEAVACIAMILRKFDVDVVRPEDVAYTVALTLMMKNGLKVRISERENPKTAVLSS
jgi:hypothetical protein